MRKSKQSIKQAVKGYIADVSQRFPGLSVYATLQPEVGVEAWLWIELDAQTNRLWDEIRAYTSNLTLRLLDEEDLNIVAIPTTKKEPVHG